MSDIRTPRELTLTEIRQCMKQCMKKIAKSKLPDKLETTASLQQAIAAINKLTEALYV